MTQRVDKDSLPLDKPRRTPGHPTKSHIVKTKVDGKEKIIRFGEQGAETAGKPKAGESDRMKQKRASFKARHAKNIAKGKSSPAYWANKVKWAEGGAVNMAAGGAMRMPRAEGPALQLIEQMRRSNPQSQEFDPVLASTREQRARPARRPQAAPQTATPQAVAPLAAMRAPEPREAPLPLPPTPPAMRPDENPPPEAPPNPMRFDEGNPHVATAISMAQRYNLPPSIFLSLVQQESGFNPEARSRRGAIGLGQLMPATARELGVNPLDPEQNLEGSARYLRRMLDQFGDMELALAAYNAGPGTVRRAGNTIPNIRETQRYVPSILRRAGVQQGEFAEGGLADLDQKYAEGGEVMSDEEYDRRLLSRMKAQTGRVTEPTRAEQMQALRNAGTSAAEGVAEFILPQSPLDAALMVALGPGGRAARLAGSAALAALEPSEAEASRLYRLTQLLRREAPAQADTVREALRGAAQSNREHAVVGAAEEAVAPSRIVSGSVDRVVPNATDRRLALQSLDNVLDFHTHPSSETGYSRFGVAPSRTDFEYYLQNYPDMRDQELRTLIAAPPHRSDPTSYNFFATDRPSQVFNPRAFDDAAYELQFAAGKGKYDSILNDPNLQDYFDQDDYIYDLIKEAAPLALLSRRAEQGLGRQERALSRQPITPDMTTEEDMYRRMEPIMLDILRDRKFAEGGAVNAEPLPYNADAVDALVKQIEAEYV